MFGPADFATPRLRFMCAAVFRSGIPCLIINEMPMCVVHSCGTFVKALLHVLHISHCTNALNGRIQPGRDEQVHSQDGVAGGSLQVGLLPEPPRVNESSTVFCRVKNRAKAKATDSIYNAVQSKIAYLVIYKGSPCIA